MTITTYNVLTLIALGLGLLWPIYQLVRHLCGPSLRLKLTKRLFFRYIDLGECIFINPILLAERGNISVQDIKAQLVRLDKGATKEWDIEFIHFGERVRNSNNILADHFFDSASPLNFIPSDRPLKAVYLGRVKYYAGDYLKVLRSFRDELGNLKTRVPIAYTDSNKQVFEDINKELFALVDKFKDELSNQIQIERGNYHLSLQVTYFPLGRIFSKHKTVSSKIKFLVEDNAQQLVKVGIPLALYTEGSNYLFNRTDLIIYPEYTPIDVVEE